MSEKKMDISKVLAILAQPKEAPEPLENVERLRLEVPYITKEGTVDIRAVKAVMPKDAAQPTPLIYVPHYEMGEDSLELRDYLAEGWAAACPAEFNDSYNGKLTDDDLVFNNAALYALRHRPEFDKNRIALAGGSAGGYMTMMLNGLQLGICASVANGPITNTYFNFEYYFKKASELNNQALFKMMAENAGAKAQGEEQNQEKSALAVLERLKSLPIPFLAGLSGMFGPIGDNFPDKEDTRRWEALSAVGIADCFSSPIMVNHCTSDVLVPVDQISRSYTYPKPGDSLPEDFDAGLSRTFPGKLKYSLEECLPKEDTRTARIPVPEKAEDMDLPYDSSKRFNINIFDDGPIEGYGTHSSRMDVGRRRDVPYFKEMFERTAAVNCVLTPSMLKSLLVRFQGGSIALPAHTGVDDSVYGSLCVYQKEVCEELADWVENHGEEAVRDVFEAVLQDEKNETVREELIAAMKEIFKEEGKM